MTTKLFFKRYWRVPVVALLGALIAFGGSFMLEETYTSTHASSSVGSTPT